MAELYLVKYSNISGEALKKLRRNAYIFSSFFLLRCEQEWLILKHNHSALIVYFRKRILFWMNGKCCQIHELSVFLRIVHNNLRLFWKVFFSKNQSLWGFVYGIIIMHAFFEKKSFNCSFQHIFASSFNFQQICVHMLLVSINTTIKKCNFVHLIIIVKLICNVMRFHGSYESCT